MKGPTPLRARYVHTNLVAQDWRRLATFYEGVFGCIPVPPERDLSGEWLDALTGVPNRWPLGKERGRR